MKVQCVACGKEADTFSQLKNWRKILASIWKQRTHIGFCPDCVKKFSVEEEPCHP